MIVSDTTPYQVAFMESTTVHLFTSGVDYPCFFFCYNRNNQITTSMCQRHPHIHHHHHLPSTNTELLIWVRCDNHELIGAPIDHVVERGGIENKGWHCQLITPLTWAVTSETSKCLFLRLSKMSIWRYRQRNNDLVVLLRQRVRFNAT